MCCALRRLARATDGGDRALSLTVPASASLSLLRVAFCHTSQQPLRHSPCLNRCLPFRRCSVYLRGFACTKVPDSWTVTTERFRRTALTNFGIEPRAAEFCLKLLGRSGIGEQSAFPPGIMSYPPDLSMRAAREEADFVMSNALDQLFESTGVKPKDVDILIVNCSIFSPTPSLAAMIVNKYKMRENILSYNLSGMVRSEREQHEQASSFCNF